MASAALSTYLQNGLIDRLFHEAPSFTAPGTGLKLELFSDVADDSGGTPLTYTGYAAGGVAIDFTAASGRVVTQNGIVAFGKNTSGAQTALSWGVFAGANMLAYGDVDPDKLISVNNTPSIANGAIVLTASAGNISDYLANFFLDYAFNNGTDPSTLVPYAFLSTTDFTTSGAGSSLTEPADNYVRVIADTWTVSTNTATNTNSIPFAVPGANWGAITCVGIVTGSAANTGEVLYFDNAPTGAEQNPASGDTVSIPATTFDASIA
jgi:hypothetical protein